jgi:hypothetical protein
MALMAGLTEQCYHGCVKLKHGNKAAIAQIGPKWEG